MLKIKDNVDLKELEKYGYKKSDGYYYKFYDESKNFGIKTGTRIQIFNNTITEGQILQTTIDKLGFQSTREELAINIFDLIKDGLVEKVEG